MAAIWCAIEQCRRAQHGGKRAAHAGQQHSEQHWRSSAVCHEPGNRSKQRLLRQVQPGIMLAMCVCVVLGTLIHLERMQAFPS